MALFVATCILAAAFSLGAQALSLLGVWKGRRRALPVAEQALFAFGLGIVLLAYAVLAVGLVGLLKPWVLVALLVLCGALGAGQYRVLAQTVGVLAGALRRGITRPGSRRLVYVFLLLWSVLVLLSAMAPAIDIDYDGLSQHLASPKIYLRHQRIEPLWFDHHSHFPSTLQMLYTVALGLGSAEAPKVIHWACGIAAALALIVVGRRFLSPDVGAWAAFTLVTVPLTGRLGTLAYVDLGSVFFAALLLLGLRTWLHSRRGAHLFLAAVAAGGGMAVKMQGIQLCALAVGAVFASALWLRLGLGKALRRAVAFGTVACVLASPWYVKSLLWTGNPVYPFAYGLFGGKYWSAKQARDYREHQLEFGVGSPPDSRGVEAMGLLARTFSGPRRPTNLLLAPWNAAMQPSEFVVTSLSPVHAALWEGVGPLFLALLPLLMLRRPPGTVTFSLGLFAVMWVGWLLLMQYLRYLLPSLVFASVPAAHVLVHGVPRRGLGPLVPRAVAWCWGALALAAVCFAGLLFGSWRAGLGLVDRATYLQTHSAGYRFAEWVNTLTPEKANIALYSEPRGFYLDRDYIWADAGHSRLIEYDRIDSGEDLLDAYAGLGVTHILYRELPGAPKLFGARVLGAALADLVREDQVRVIGRLPSDSSYVLLQIETPWAKELLG